MPFAMKNKAENQTKNKAKNKIKKDKIKIMPLGSRVLVVPDEADEVTHKKTSSGIFIPESGREERPEQGQVIATGEGEYRDGVLVPLKVKAGDRVIFSKYGYDEVKLDGKKYFVIKEENILAIVK